MQKRIKIPGRLDVMNKKITCVFKIVERCNIDCTYCYFFHGGDESYKKHPPYVSLETTQELANFLKQGCEELGLKKVIIGYHGGEPMMIGANQLGKMCEIFNTTLSGIAEVEFGMQTNAMLVNQKWIDLLNKYKIDVGVSLDGPKKYNDIHRLDKRKKSTYELTVIGLKKLMEGLKHSKPGVLSVINPESNPSEIYRHFVDVLGIKSMDFLLPHNSYHSPLPAAPEMYGQFLSELFDVWQSDDDPAIHVRFFDDVLSSFLGGYSSVYGRGFNNRNNAPPHLINISSNGDLGPVSELMVTSDKVMHTGCNIRTHKLSELLSSPIFTKLTCALESVPDACQQCCWQRVCGGGDLVTRYSLEKEFNNQSILCAGLYHFYSRVATYLLNNKVKESEILSNLGIKLPSTMGAINV